MPDLIIRNLDEGTASAIKTLAIKHSVSFDAEVKKILHNGVKSSLATEKLIEEFRCLRAKGPRMPDGWDIDEIINEGRE